MTKNEILEIAKPILFNTEMVRAILDDRKSVTRMVISEKVKDTWLSRFWVCDKSNRCCKYQVGDYLYVRETFNDTETDTILYAADKEFVDFGCKEVNGFLFMESDIKWKPSIHMPKVAARIFLKVTDVRVERLEEMTQEDCILEGCGELSEEQFAHVWNSTIKKTDLDHYGWDANPWVWVIEFEKVEVE